VGDIVDTRTLFPSPVPEQPSPGDRGGDDIFEQALERVRLRAELAKKAIGSEVRWSDVAG
jgi:hypothetical protein